MSSADVISMLEEHEVKFVDLRFADTKGKEQHVTIPAHQVDDSFFEDGKMFDGSSVAGWKGINESDMILMPDPDTAMVDVFTEDATVNIRCDVVEPSTMQGYNRCPRSTAKRAEEYLASTGIADQAFFGPENEFFVFDDVRFKDDVNGCMYRVDSAEGAWNTDTVHEDGNIGHRPGLKGGYFPVPPVDS
jgi:glutamine synthetase